MQYRTFGRMPEKVSALGFGAMRLPTAGDGIDRPEAIRLIRHAIDTDVNYVDTAYFYHNGESEVVVGEALKGGYRNKTYVATKSPLSYQKTPEDFDRLLDEQLRRLQIDTIDFYLLHAVDRSGWNDVAVKFDLLEKMERAKAAGKIRHIGFSFHDNFDCFRTVVDAYDHWDFCQLQLNYVDVDHQAGLQGMAYAAARGMGVIVMEPLLGGKLAAPPESVCRLLPPERTPVEWALDFLWNKPEIGPVLSGMSNAQQVEDNLTYASRATVGMLNASQEALFAAAKTAYETMARVPCTGCGYCMPCPFGVEIPRVFEAYNRTAVDAPEAAAGRYAALDGRADACKACGKCTRVCPQHLNIPERMREVVAHFAR